jgi:hypothetical protein
MPASYDAPMPPNLLLGTGFLIEVDAIDPSTGAHVAGVKTTSFTIMADEPAAAGADGGGVALADWLLIPGPNA